MKEESLTLIRVKFPDGSLIDAELIQADQFEGYLQSLVTWCRVGEARQTIWVPSLWCSIDRF